MEEIKENVEQIKEEGDEIVAKLHTEIQELKSQLFDEKMKREADKNRFEKAMDIMNAEHQQKYIELRVRLEKRSALDVERALKKFLTKHVFNVCDLLKNIIASLEETNPELAKAVSISLNSIVQTLKSENFEEVLVNKGDEYNADIHNALEVIGSVENGNDVVHEVYCSAWIKKSDNKSETIRYADVSIEKTEAITEG